ncbi:MAG: hypothetical protein WBH01_04315 [Dehalococcoidia bacterium]
MNSVESKPLLMVFILLVFVGCGALSVMALYPEPPVITGMIKADLRSVGSSVDIDGWEVRLEDLQTVTTEINEARLFITGNTSKVPVYEGDDVKSADGNLNLHITKLYWGGLNPETGERNIPIAEVEITDKRDDVLGMVARFAAPILTFISLVYLVVSIVNPSLFWKPKNLKRSKP